MKNPFASLRWGLPQSAPQARHKQFSSTELQGRGLMLSFDLDAVMV